MRGIRKRANDPTNKRSKKDKPQFSLRGNFPTSSVQPTPFLLDMHHAQKEQIIVGYLRNSIQTFHKTPRRKMHQIISKIKSVAHKSPQIPNTASYIELFLSQHIINTIKSYCVLHEKIIYSTRYEPENKDITGIISYDLTTFEHKGIKLWCDTHYFPRWHISIMNRFKHEIIFIGGSNVNKNNTEYQLIAFYDLRSERITTLNVDFVIGSNSKAVLINERDLHIIGGQMNNKHILYDLHTNKHKFIYDFGDTNPGLQEEALLYNPAKNTLMMFGGYNLDEYIYYDDFYMLDLNDTLSALSMTQVAQYLVKRYMHETFYNMDARNILMYDTSLNNIIGRYLGQTNIGKQWKRISEFTMINGTRSFGAVLYDCRIVIVLGGIVSHKLIDSIYYLDINGVDGWLKSDRKCPERGMCNAMLIGDVIHMLPYYAYTSHYTVPVSHILPNHLLLN